MILEYTFGLVFTDKEGWLILATFEQEDSSWTVSEVRLEHCNLIYDQDIYDQD